MPAIGNLEQSRGVIQSPLDLSVFIQVTLKAQKMCRVYGDLLQLCWDLPKQEQTEAIIAFAPKYGWKVVVHELGTYGMVADFTPQRETQNEVRNGGTPDLPKRVPEPKGSHASA